jgi:hypothetical protein
MKFNVCSQSTQPDRIVLGQTQGAIARMAKKATHLACVWAVVYVITTLVQFGLKDERIATSSAAVSLSRQYDFNIGLNNSVAAAQMAVTGTFLRGWLGLFRMTAAVSALPFPVVGVHAQLAVRLAAGPASLFVERSKRLNSLAFRTSFFLHCAEHNSKVRVGH